ncbi:Gfo/Idh/MocA family oxidoreductase [Diaminobutyricimonas sp. TR449]|uniref:Gfo/Idh/MocA family protein n=1 Tax=Diaminobutyricimonas sp. TR449 TaxID=2708076 RepID=UPI002443F478|nr:Gfo/Idh/MocA family oxidoreductase [Diaminobutyricimonas sp. TR449]
MSYGNRPLKVAIASFAHVHAASYIAALRDLADVVLLASDPDGATAPDRAPRGYDFAQQHRIDYVDDYDELFAWGPDAVIVTSENSRHRELVLRAAAAGAHVLCEKPLATEVADGEAMIAACEAAGAILMLAYPVRFSPAFRALKQLVDDGNIGVPFAILGTNNGKLPLDSREWFTDREAAGGGALVDHVVHCADLVDVLTEGEQALSVYAAANNLLHADKNVTVETGGLVTVQYPSGLVASIDCSWSEPDTAPTWGGLTLQVTGPKGTVEVAPFSDHVGGSGPSGAVHLGIGADLDSLLLETFLDAVRRSGPAQRGVQPAVTPQPDGQSGLRTLRIMDAARESARRRQPALL